ncbi:LysR family transcriptional regulator (plasmid) [Comamonadaceae bacterium OTU4NAUVB1]|nr:LysR family transcriptional regulator [Comamonadaceae bacterium OTU4NAUVB1]
MDKFGEMQVFLGVVNEGSFSGAGRRLGMSPSAVSKLIGRLETRLDVRLFERIAGTIRLTQEGHRFHAASLRVADAMEAAENLAPDPEGEISGTLHVHAPLTTAKYLLAPLLPALLERHPRLRLEFIIGTDRGDFLKQGIDVALHSGRPTELSLIGWPLVPRPWVIAAAPAYLARHGTPLRPDDLLRHRCLNFTIRTHWNRWTFREDGALKTIDIPACIGANQGELLRTLALVGLGIVRLAEFNVAADLRTGTLVPLLQDFQDRTDDVIYVLYPRGRVLAPRVKAFLQFLKAHFPTQAAPVARAAIR